MFWPRKCKSLKNSSACWLSLMFDDKVLTAGASSRRGDGEIFCSGRQLLFSSKIISRVFDNVWWPIYVMNSVGKLSYPIISDCGHKTGK